MSKTIEEDITERIYKDIRKLVSDIMWDELMEFNPEDYSTKRAASDVITDAILSRIDESVKDLNLTRHFAEVYFERL